MVHMDVKNFGRIPVGGGLRKLGCGNDTTKGHSAVGYACLHHVVGDCSRLTYSEILDDEKKDTVVGFWNRARDYFVGYDIAISRVLTDNRPAYRPKLFNTVLAAGQVKHVFSRPYRPQTYGKVERFNRTLVAEWAYADTYDGEAARARQYPGWLHHYNHHRPHSALGGLTPAEVVHNLTGHNT